MSNRDVPTADKKYLEFGTYGTYMVEDGILSPLGSPVWLWGHFYENVIRAILNGNWDKGHDSRHAVNYWWGMASGVIDVRLADTLPEGLKYLCNMLREGLRNGTLDPFQRKLIDQSGRVINDGSKTLSPEELLHMTLTILRPLPKIWSVNWVSDGIRFPWRRRESYENPNHLR